MKEWWWWWWYDREESVQSASLQSLPTLFLIRRLLSLFFLLRAIVSYNFMPFLLSSELS